MFQSHPYPSSRTCYHDRCPYISSPRGYQTHEEKIHWMGLGRREVPVGDQDSQKLLVTSASLLVTSALLVVTRS